EAWREQAFFTKSPRQNCAVESMSQPSDATRSTANSHAKRRATNLAERGAGPLRKRKRPIGTRDARFCKSHFREHANPAHLPRESKTGNGRQRAEGDVRWLM